MIKMISPVVLCVMIASITGCSTMTLEDIEQDYKRKQALCSDDYMGKFHPIPPRAFVDHEGKFISDSQIVQNLAPCSSYIG